ncbi:MAG: polyketide synthase dehydratase domain-containing protein [Desulfosarcina sp.]|nr:polyketide synthase dehydratase domain-containing protein [Desulfosarcina sp.]MBC2742550.1 polyketide synthase dehydratase domain-containing protein [Desulfosarcina sp.]MBC2765460.1 4'-phosphopantetheinyl transferase superfamily protein [Desulfosarcina sp.]
MAESFPIALQPPPFFRDHHVQNRPVFAAVEAMERLAADTCRRFPGNDGRRLEDIRFDKFLCLNTQDPFTAFNRIERHNDGSIRTTLTTRFKSPGANITRTLAHASLTIGPELPAAVQPPIDAAASLTGVCTAVDPARIYGEMVPFGPAYQNICGPLLISADGALARVRSPQPADPRNDLYLGSPYVLDAAFHAACVWCQRFRGVVAFPVAIDRRTVVRPTRMDDVYTARVVPVQTGNTPFVFDIFIYDAAGELREAANDVHMRDVSGGRAKPPAGFWQQTHAEPLAPFRSHVSGMVLLERRTVAAFAAAALSENEKTRLTPMAPNRARGYLSARLALKRLSRMLSGDSDRRNSREIETVAENSQSPQCPLADGTLPFCAVSHDRRFTVAVAADRPVGVDVEPLSERPLGAMHLYMDANERAMVNRLPLGRAGGALRVWSAKEAAAKALGINLAESWERIRVMEVASECSLLEIARGKRMSAIHATIEGHLFTLLTVDNAS